MYPLRRISISGFKSFAEPLNLELHNLNIIIGANGAGKSNFIQLLCVLQAMAQQNLQRYILLHGEADTFLHQGIKETSHIEGELEFVAPASEGQAYHFKLEPGMNQNFALSERLNTMVPFSAPCPESQLLRQYFPDVSASGMNVGNIIRSWGIYHFHDTGTTAGMRRSEIMDDNNQLRPSAENLAPFLLRLKREYPEQYKKILWAVQTVMPFLEDFELKVYQAGAAEKVKLTWYQRGGTGYPMQPFQFSDGSLRFICLATALLQPHLPPTMVIDEPELGLHPEAIEVLAALLKSAARQTQVIVATQSPMLLDAFAVQDIIVAKRHKNASCFQRLDDDDLKIWLEDYSLGELWRKNVIQGGTSHEG